MLAYQNPRFTVDERVEDLIGRMTLKEKAGQCNQRMFGWDAYRKTAHGFELTDAFRDEVATYGGMGALYGLLRADPWSKVSFENGIDAAAGAKVANEIQRYLKDNTRLGIPALLVEECPHGHQALDGTLFPTNLGVGATWNPELAGKAYAHAAAEIRSRGGTIALFSALDVLRDPRWGRAEECFGEDPYLAARMTESIVKGMQGDGPEGLRRGDKVAVVLKHFAAQGACEGGRNLGPASIGERELRELHLPVMKVGAEAGAAGCMAAYNEIDGVPCHANRKLLTGVLREEWDFRGIVMADGTAIDRLLMQTGEHERAAALAMKAGVDLSLWDISYTTIENAVISGQLYEADVDRAVRRILRLKFMLGLFDEPYVDEALAAQVVGAASTRAVNLALAQQSIVLLKNEGGTLPLTPSVRRIAVIGPGADDTYRQLGDYTSAQQPGRVVTALQGIEQAAPPDTEIAYARGCGGRDRSKDGFAEAVALAASSDVAVLIMGGSSARDFGARFTVTGAADVTDGTPSEMDCGEGVDLADLRLGGVQAELVREVAATGTPVVLVLIQGRPHAIAELEPDCAAILSAWYPGQEGGRAIGDILFGIVNPSGRLPVSVPRSSDILPVYYNYKDLGKAPGYVDAAEGIASYPFGYGLGYSRFDYGTPTASATTLRKESLDEGVRLEIAVELTNAGAVEGAEVVQLYVKHLDASVTTRVKELKGFQRTSLPPGGKETVQFSIGKEELSLWDADMRYTVERGRKLVMVGPNAADVQQIMITIL